MITMMDLVVRNRIKFSSPVGIGNPIYPHSTRTTSHRSSWAFMLADQMKHIGFEDVKVLDRNDDWNSCDIIVIDWGMEYKGTFNLLGGIDQSLTDRLKMMSEFKGQVISAHIPFPDVHKFVCDRFLTEKFSEFYQQLDFGKIALIQEKADFFEEVDYSNQIIFGDSHSLSIYKPGFRVMRNDGLTLYGALQKGLKNLIPQDSSELIIYLGNIDIRHHICRFHNWYAAIRDLVLELQKQLQELQSCGIPKISINALLPIENEDRHIPKTGYYKGTPFFGTQQLRSSAAMTMNSGFEQICENNGWEFLYWPSEWYKMKPEEYAEKCMEKPGSVHLARHSYRHKF